MTQEQKELWIDGFETLLGYLKHISGKYYFNLPQELPRVIQEADAFLNEQKSSPTPEPGKEYTREDMIGFAVFVEKIKDEDPVMIAQPMGYLLEKYLTMTYRLSKKSTPTTQSEGEEKKFSQQDKIIAQNALRAWDKAYFDASEKYQPVVESLIELIKWYKRTHKVGFVLIDEAESALSSLSNNTNKEKP